MGIFGAVVLIIAIILSIVVPGFRKAVICISVGGAAIIAFFVINYNEKKKKSLTIISSQQLSFTELQMVLGSYSKVTGKIKNLSLYYTLERVTLTLHAYDCPENYIDHRCAAIGQTGATLFVDIPPGQVRSIDTTAIFSDMPAVKNHFVWNYEVGEIAAKVD